MSLDRSLPRVVGFISHEAAAILRAKVEETGRIAEELVSEIVEKHLLQYKDSG